MLHTVTINQSKKRCLKYVLQFVKLTILSVPMIGSGCIAAGFTLCCAFGACRVDLPDGGHCYCDRECFSYAHHNCCSDNPCDGKFSNCKHQTTGPNSAKAMIAKYVAT